jgi:hypothetical protein
LSHSSADRELFLFPSNFISCYFIFFHFSYQNDLRTLKEFKFCALNHVTFLRGLFSHYHRPVPMPLNAADCDCTHLHLYLRLTASRCGVPMRSVGHWHAALHSGLVERLVKKITRFNKGTSELGWRLRSDTGYHYKEVTRYMALSNLLSFSFAGNTARLQTTLSGHRPTDCYLHRCFPLSQNETGDCSLCF